MLTALVLFVGLLIYFLSVAAEQTQSRLRDMEALRKDLQALKDLASRQEGVIEQLEKRPWWKFWG